MSRCTFNFGPGTGFSSQMKASTKSSLEQNDPVLTEQAQAKEPLSAECCLLQQHLVMTGQQLVDHFTFCKWGHCKTKQMSQSSMLPFSSSTEENCLRCKCSLELHHSAAGLLCWSVGVTSQCSPSKLVSVPQFHTGAWFSDGEWA